MKHMILFGLSAMIFASCGDTAPRENVESPNPSNIDAVLVVVDTLAGTVPIDGTVEARKQTAISTRMMARVTSVNVDVGSRVRAGQVLIELGTDEVASDRSMAHASLQSALAARDEARRNAARMDTLYAQDVVAMVQRDQAHLALTLAEAQVVTAQAGLDRVQTAERYATIRAPFDGGVIGRDINPGDLALPGVPLLHLNADGPRDVVFGVAVDLARDLAVGTLVTVDGGSLGVAHARVRAVASGADARSRTLEVKAELPPTWPTGVAVTVLVPSGVHAAIVIPEAAVVRRGQLTGVRVVSNNGEMLRWIRLGRQVRVPTADGSVETRVEVLSGLQAGERILP